MEHDNGQQDNNRETATVAQTPAEAQVPAQGGEPVQAQDTANRAEPDSHSGLGIASFAIAVSALLMFVTSIIFLFVSDLEVLMTVIHDQMSDEELTRVIMTEVPLLIVGMLLILVASFLTLVGAALGLAGLFQPSRKRLFAILGTILNGASVLFFLLVGLTVFFTQ